MEPEPSFHEEEVKADEGIDQDVPDQEKKEEDHKADLEVGPGVAGDAPAIDVLPATTAAKEDAGD